MTEAAQGSAADEQKLQRYASELAERVEESIGLWVVAQVKQFWLDSAPVEVLEAAESAAQRAEEEIGPKLRALLELDIDEQWTNPLAIIRTVVDYPTQVLSTAGVPPVERDNTARQFHPTDIYDLTPGGFASLGPGVGEAGLLWGAAKAHVHLQRRAAKGR